MPRVWGMPHKIQGADAADEGVVVDGTMQGKAIRPYGSKSGKKHPLPIDLSTENKKAKGSAYEKEMRPGRSFNRKWKDKMNLLTSISYSLLGKNS